MLIPPRPAPPPAAPAWRQALRLFGQDLLAGLPDAAFERQVVHLPVLRRAIVLVNDPTVLREVFVAQHAAYAPKSRLMEQALAPVLGSSLFIGHGPEWARRRAAVARLLHPAGLTRFRPAMRRSAAELVASWAAGGEREVTAPLAEATTRIMLRAVLGEAAPVAAAAGIAQGLARYQDGVRLVDPAWLLALPDAWVGRQGARAAREAARLRALVSAAMAQAGEGGMLPELRALLPEPEPLLDEVAMFLLAGSETAAATLGWALYLLALAPDWQARLREEAAEEGAALRAVLNETLRLYPPVPFLTRRADAPGRIRRWAIRRGDLVLASPWLLQRNPAHWPDPHAFRPERWLGGEAAGRAFIPFGLGPRACAGAAFGMAEMAVLLSAVLARFAVLPGDQPVRPVARLTLRPLGGIRLRFSDAPRRS